MYRISTIKTPTSLCISRFKLHTSLWNIAVKTRIPAYRANEKDCLLLFRCSHIRPINMVKHQEVQLLSTHTFAVKLKGKYVTPFKAVPEQGPHRILLLS